MPLPVDLGEDFSRFAFTADDWLIEYAQQSCGVTSMYVFTFSFAISFELYLKAYFTKLTQDAIEATKFGHKIDNLLDAIEKIESNNFLSSLKFNTKLSKYPLHELDEKSWQCPWFTALDSIDQEELKNNYEFYMLMAYSPDLKYGISPSLAKYNGRIISSSWNIFNPRFNEIIIQIRNRIGYPKTREGDRLKYAILNPRVEENAKNYLRRIIHATQYRG